LEVETALLSTVNKYGHERIDQHTLAEMLTIILEKIRTYPDRDHFEADILVKGLKEPSLPLIVTQMSLKTIESHIKMRDYKVSEAFIHDIKQLEHNWSIIDRSKTKTLKSILKYVVTEINELEACVYCYEESFVSGDWFIHPCKRPHLLIWAKLKGVI
jgi:protein kinase C-binding protein 1